MKYPDDYFTADELKVYRQLDAKVRMLDETWKKIGGSELLRELSLATLDLVRFKEKAARRKQRLEK